jgi:hypothetical protein
MVPGTRGSFPVQVDRPEPRIPGALDIDAEVVANVQRAGVRS